MRMSRLALSSAVLLALLCPAAPASAMAPSGGREATRVAAAVPRASPQAATVYAPPIPGVKRWLLPIGVRQVIVVSATTWRTTLRHGVVLPAHDHGVAPGHPLAGASRLRRPRRREPAQAGHRHDPGRRLPDHRVVRASGQPGHPRALHQGHDGPLVGRGPQVGVLQPDAARQQGRLRSSAPAATTPPSGSRRWARSTTTPPSSTSTGRTR